MTEENKNVQIQIQQDQSDYREVTDKCVRGLRTHAQANSLAELTLRALAKGEQGVDHRVLIEERKDGLFDMIVLKRTN